MEHLPQWAKLVSNLPSFPHQFPLVGTSTVAETDPYEAHELYEPQWYTLLWLSQCHLSPFRPHFLDYPTNLSRKDVGQLQRQRKLRGNFLEGRVVRRQILKT